MIRVWQRPTESEAQVLPESPAMVCTTVRLGDEALRLKLTEFRRRPKDCHLTIQVTGGHGLAEGPPVGVRVDRWVRPHHEDKDRA